MANQAPEFFFGSCRCQPNIAGPVAWRTGDLDGDGLTDIFHTRISNSMIDVNVYISSGTGYSYDYTYSLCCFSNLSTHGWLVGSFDGGPRESLLHMFPFSGGLSMVVYGLP